MLDANLCIRVLRDRPRAAGERFRVEADSLAISTIVLHELQFGALRSRDPTRQRKEVAEFARLISVFDFDSSASAHAADIKSDLTGKGQIIGPNDLLIAGHARSLGLKLITGNLREFTRVEGLRCEDWL
jgi:tRNA(fMet)-specific endonuclease VapC